MQLWKESAHFQAGLLPSIGDRWRVQNIGKASGCSWGPALRHGSCSLSVSGQFNFMVHLLCTSIMYKARVELVGSQWPRCVTGDPQGDWEPSEAFLCQGMLVHPTLWWLSLSGNLQQKQDDCREKSRCCRMMTGKKARWREWSCSKGNGALQRGTGDLRGRSYFMCPLVIGAAKDLQPPSPAPPRLIKYKT